MELQAILPTGRPLAAILLLILLAQSGGGLAVASGMSQPAGATPAPLQYPEGPSVSLPAGSPGGRDLAATLWESPGVDTSTFPLPTFPFVQTTDLDGDGTQEILATEYNDSTAFTTAVVYAGPAHAQRWRSPAGNGSVNWIGVLQADFDPAREIVLSTGSTMLRVFDGATFQEQYREPGWSDDVSPAVITDVDADGSREVLLERSVAGNTSVAVTDLATGADEWVGPGWTKWLEFRVGNVDSDPQQEIVVVRNNDSGGADRSEILVYDGANHTLQADIPGLGELSSCCGNVQLADLNGDGADEVFVAYQSCCASPPRVQAFNGTTGLELWHRDDYVRDARIGDFNGDGKLDVTYTGSLGSVIVAGATGALELSFSGSPYEVGSDLDGDGDLDIFTATWDTSGLHFHLLDATTGNETMGSQFNYTGFNGVEQIGDWREPLERYAIPGDLDNDGSPDLLLRLGNSFGTDQLLVIDARDGSQNHLSVNLDRGQGTITAAFPIDGPDAWAVVTGSGALRLWNPRTPPPVWWNSAWTDSGIAATGVQFVDLGTNGTVQLLVWGTDTATKKGHLWLMDIDWSPVQLQSIPDLAIDEDTTVPGALDLDLYFRDDVAPVLSYTVSSNNASVRLNATINGSLLDLRAARLDWNGVIKLRVSASDGVSAPVESNSFNVTIRPVNDPPVIDPVVPQLLRQGDAFHLQLTAQDPDRDPLGWSSNDSRFPVDATDGTVDLVPSNADVGNHVVRFRVTDPFAGSGTTEVLFDVENLNDPPSLPVIPDQVADEGTPFVLDINATDIDAGERLFFTDDSPLFAVESLEGGRGRIDFNATNDEVGPWPVHITVTDSAGAHAATAFTVTVRNTNDPPALRPVADQQVDERTIRRVFITADDPDLMHGDQISFFLEDAPGFVSIDGVTGSIALTPSSADLGEYSFTVGVRDLASASDRATIRVTVLNVNDRPTDVQILEPAANATVEGAGLWLLGTALDADPFDVLAFTWWDDGVRIASGNDTTANLTPGVHRLRLQVTDLAGASGSAELTVTVAASHHPPARPNPVSGESPVAFLLIGVVVAAILLLVLSRMRARRARREPPSDERDSLTPSTPPDGDVLPPPPGRGQNPEFSADDPPQHLNR